MSEDRNAVARYTTAGRINHWITAVSLILLALSGMALFHPSLYFLTNLFGGGRPIGRGAWMSAKMGGGSA